MRDFKYFQSEELLFKFKRHILGSAVRHKNGEIAERLGTSRNAINRALQDLKAKNLIRLSRGKITLVK